MKRTFWKLTTIFTAVLCLTVFGAALSSAKGPGGGGGGGGKPNPETAGNNLSFPVIWSEGVKKILPGTPGMDPALNGEWWYQWGTNGVDPDITPASCPPDPDEVNPILNPGGNPFCDDDIELTLSKPAGEPAADNPLPLAKAYLQKDQSNTWQAWSGTPVDAGVAQGEGEFKGELWVDWIDWGDNLESVDWYTRSQVRTEVVLFQDLETPMTEYEMRHTDGWGIDEVHGLAATLAEPPAAIPGPGTQATVYSPCARLTIQKLLVERDDVDLENLVWVWDPDVGEPYWTESGTYEGGPLINDPIFNMAVHEAQDGPGYYNAEINVKGRIIYGYTWNVRRLNDDFGGTAAGDYRITFSFDGTFEESSCGGSVLNTFFVDDTEIIVPLEEEIAAAAAAEGDDGESPGGGAVGMLDTGNNLTYIDVRILERGGGGGGGGSGGGSGGGGGNDR